MAAKPTVATTSHFSLVEAALTFLKGWLSEIIVQTVMVIIKFKLTQLAKETARLAMW